MLQCIHQDGTVRRKVGLGNCGVHACGGTTRTTASTNAQRHSCAQRGASSLLRDSCPYRAIPQPPELPLDFRIDQPSLRLASVLLKLDVNYAHSASTPCSIGGTTPPLSPFSFRQQQHGLTVRVSGPPMSVPSQVVAVRCVVDASLPRSIRRGPIRSVDRRAGTGCRVAVGRPPV